MLWLDQALKLLGLVPKPEAGLRVQSEAADTPGADVSRGLTPEHVDRVMAAANAGETMEYCRLAMELEEKNWDIAQAVATRRQALAGLEWEVEAAGEGKGTDETDETDSRAEEIAQAAEGMLRSAQPPVGTELVSFEQGLFGGLASALLPGVACAELCWSKGGAELLGMQPIEARHLIFRDETGRLLGRPRLVTTGAPNGLELPLGKFAMHFHQPRAGARCRGGLIRPLAWLHCFQNVNIKDLLTFVERYGMPFLVVKVSPDSWAAQRSMWNRLVRSFGPGGGGVVTENVQTELLQAANTTGDVYFRLLEYCGEAITRVVLGQTATSSEGGGWSKDGAQSAVRQDILEADCRALAETVRTEILRPWTAWNYGPNAPTPRFRLKCEPPEDLKATAETVAALYSAGLEWDAEEASERTGLKLTRKAPPPPPPPVFGGALPQTPPGSRGSPDPTGMDAAAGTPGDGRAAAAPAAEPSTAEEGEEDAVGLMAEGGNGFVVEPAGGPMAPAAGPSVAQHPADAIAAAVARQVTASRGLDDWFAPVRIAVEAALRGLADGGNADVGDDWSTRRAQHLRARLERLLAQMPELLAQVDGTEFAEALQAACMVAYTDGFKAEADKITP
jgi:phage gp29-like protein